MPDYTDSLGLSDFLHVVQGSALAGDALGLSDSIGMAVPAELADTLTDDAGLADWLHVVVGSALPADSLGLSDAGFEAPLPLPWTDSMGLSDGLAVETGRALSDPLGLSDELTTDLFVPDIPAPVPAPPPEGRVWRLLPDYVRAADAAGVMEAFCDSAEVGLSRAASFLAIVDADQSVSGTCELTNPAACPRAYLPWLGWLLGINTSALPDAEVREALAAAGQSQRRGSVGAIRRAVQRTLTGSKTCRVYRNTSGTDPYLLTVITLTAETADTGVSLAAAWSEKPAGMDLELTPVTGPTWADLVAARTDWADVVSAFATWDDVVDWTP